MSDRAGNQADDGGQEARSVKEALGQVCGQPDAVAVDLPAQRLPAARVTVPDHGPRLVDEAVALLDHFEERREVVAAAGHRACAQGGVEPADLIERPPAEGHVGP